ncbi:MAG: 50S ribosomal protein L24 [Acidobacteria bacterium]|nr:50S ribosomal protein L24 [Acidobacteriota bacterium]MCA1609389.1 50S ribosomal protein L24 [Acidobacteriota bacterium]
MKKKTKLRKNDVVMVIAGKDRGRQGRILRVLPAADRVIVERVNMIKRHTRPNPSKNIAGGISEKEAPLHISNVMLIDPDRSVPTRIGRRRDAEGTPERFAKKSGAALA